MASDAASGPSMPSRSLPETEALYRQSIDSAREASLSRRFSRSSRTSQGKTASQEPNARHDGTQRVSRDETVVMRKRDSQMSLANTSLDPAAGASNEGSAAEQGGGTASGAAQGDEDADTDVDSEIAHPSFLGSSVRSNLSARPTILPPAAFLTPKKGSARMSPAATRTPSPFNFPIAQSPVAGRSPGQSPTSAATEVARAGAWRGSSGWTEASSSRAASQGTGHDSAGLQQSSHKAHKSTRAPSEHASRDPLLPFSTRQANAMSGYDAQSYTGKSPSPNMRSTPKSRSSRLEMQPSPRPRSKRSSVQEKPAEKPSSYPRKWKLFQGANKFFCFGRIMTADDNPLPFFGATLVVVAFPILWFIFVAPFTWRHVSPAPVILTAYTWLVTLSSMMVTSWRDPGVLPRDLDPDPPCTTSDGDPMDPEDPLAIPLPRIVRVPQSTDLKVKWCETCGTYRPPRASHCRTCDNCVENIDHHCTFLNTCIGRRNYFSFFSFLIAGITLCCLCLIFSAVHLYLLTRPLDDPLPGGGFGSGLDFAGALRKAPLSAVLFLVPIWVLVPLCVLFGYHMRLVSMNRTTVEQIRINSQKEYGEKSRQSDAVASHRCVPALGRPGRDPNPFAVPNFFANAFEVLCRPIPESYIDRSGRAVPDNRRPNPAWRSSSMGRQASDIANDGSPRV